MQKISSSFFSRSPLFQFSRISKLKMIEITSIHGLNYIRNRNLTAIERTFWFLAFILSIILCGFLIFGTIEKYINNPIIVRASDSAKTVDEIPFPAVTFCIEHDTAISKDFEYGDLSSINFQTAKLLSADQ